MSFCVRDTYYMNKVERLFLVLFTFLICLFGSIAQAQILDDTTKQIYGPNTTKYFFEKDLLDDSESKYVLDTSIQNFHRYTYTQRYQNRYQDLGIMGTALRPVFFETPTDIGARLGVDSYRLLGYDSQKIKYYDTKSPFTQAYYAQGSNSDQELTFLYTRNINSRWNVGFEYGRVNADRQFGSASRDDRLSDAIRFLLFTSYQSENEKYQLLYHFAHLNLSTSETGGVLPNELLPNDGLFSLRDSDAKLGRTADSRESISTHHLFQQYKIDPAFTVFHRLEIRRQLDAFNDRSMTNNGDFYPTAQSDLILTSPTGVSDTYNVFNFNAINTSEQTIYNTIENTAGIKGKLAKFNYRLFFKNRLFRWTTSYEDDILRTLAPDSSTASQRRIDKRIIGGLNNMVGGTLFYQFGDSSRLEADAEILLGDNYRIRGVFQNQNFEASFQSMLYSPSLFQQRFISNHFEWDNGFSNILVNRATGGFTLETRNKKLSFNPQASYTVINNFVYLDSLARPRQTTDFIQLIQVGTSLDFQLGVLHSRNLAFFTANTGESFLRIPEIFLNAQIYCEDCFLKKYLQSQIGIDVHYKSGYFADAYMPVSKQFYLQDNFFVEGYAIIDLFLNVKVKNLRLFLRFSHVNQLPDSGYVTTPTYPGAPRNFVFGANWLFFK